jgi:peptidoglycan DL-endopeptidase RipA
MNIRRKVLATTATLTTAAALVAFPASAHADYSFYRNAPTIGACWERVNAYGGVYQLQTMNVNNTDVDQVGRVVVERPGEGVIQDESWTAAPGEWKPGPVVNMSMVTGDVFVYYLGGEEILRLAQNAIPFYMSHCQDVTSASPAINRAVSYGLAQLGAYYVGCGKDDYRKGRVAATDMEIDGRTDGCGQDWIYLLPAGHKGFDCSGLIFKMFEYAGVEFDYDSSRQIYSDPVDILEEVPYGAMLPGDLLVKNGHVAMYVGNDRVLEASTDNGVIVEKLDRPRRQLAEGVHLTDLSNFPDSTYKVQRVKGL